MWLAECIGKLNKTNESKIKCYMHPPIYIITNGTHLVIASKA